MRLYRIAAAVCVTTALAAAAPSISGGGGDGCQVNVVGYAHASTWESGAIRILIEADSACGHRPGGLLELKDVRVTVESGSSTRALLHSPSGALSQSQGRLVLDLSGDHIINGSRLAKAALLVDLKTRTIHSPQGKYIDLK